MQGDFITGVLSTASGFDPDHSIHVNDALNFFVVFNEKM